jgi:hypothetical protein
MYSAINNEIIRKQKNADNNNNATDNYVFKVITSLRPNNSNTVFFILTVYNISNSERSYIPLHENPEL